MIAGFKDWLEARERSQDGGSRWRRFSSPARRKYYAQHRTERFSKSDFTPGSEKHQGGKKQQPEPASRPPR